jgi:hypothetical protein
VQAAFRTTIRIPVNMDGRVLEPRRRGLLFRSGGKGGHTDGRGKRQADSAGNARLNLHLVLLDIQL